MSVMLSYWDISGCHAFHKTAIHLPQNIRSVMCTQVVCLYTVHAVMTS